MNSRGHFECHPENHLSLCASGVNPRKVQLLDEHSAGDSLLDVGCGNGLYPLVTTHTFHRVLQVDVVDRRMDRARHLAFLEMDAGRIASLRETFTTIACFDVMEHLDDDDAFMAGLRKKCMGVLIGSVPNADDSQLQLVGLTYMHHTDKTHRRCYTYENLHKKLIQHGFCDVSIIPQYTYGLVEAAKALRTESFVSKACAKIVTSSCWALCKLGVFRNQAVADWFFVAH